MTEESGGKSAVTNSPNSVPGRDGGSHHQDVSARARKVRKGTRSCWECKRRKIRCIYASAHDVTCLGCQKRRTSCVSQDLPEALSPARKGSRHLGDRISKVEDALKDILDGRNADTIGHGENKSERARSSRSEISAAGSDASPHPSNRAPPTPPESLEEPRSNPSDITPRSPVEDGQAEAKRILRHLFAAFPCDEDIRILLTESSKTSIYNDAIYTQPHSNLTSENLAPPYPEAELPDHKTHPVLVAKFMLTLALTLQLPPTDGFLGLSEPPSKIMRRLVTAVTTWVTNQEEMQGTVEGLICIILEGVFETKCGNLRRAWVVHRRAMTVAQLMGLHRSPMPPLKRIRPEIDVHPEILWFRIVYMDRYLSLLLGLPQGTSDTSMGKMSSWRNDTPLGKFERLLTVIASRILERNERAFAHSELTTTEDIDAELLEVSSSMPSSFWRPVNFHGFTAGMPDTLLETLRLGAHVYYYGLLIQLHLPYMIPIGDNTECEYSKVACVNASREILTRFIVHRSFNPLSSCSRPVDFFALLAAMTLLLAHLDSHQHPENTNVLAHQRVSDRAMLEQVPQRLEAVSAIDGNVMPAKSAVLVRQLLDIESDAAQGGSYIASSVRDGEQEQIEADDEDLRLNIPYLGVIKIARQGGISREPWQGDLASRLDQTANADLSKRLPYPSFNNGIADMADGRHTDERAMNHLNYVTQDYIFSDNLLASKPIDPQLHATSHDRSMPQQSSIGNDTVTPPVAAELPSITASIDDWAFQGVDTAFFDSLMRGASSLDPVRSEQQWVEDALGLASAHV